MLLEPTGIELEQISTNRYSIIEGDPLSALAEHEMVTGLRRGDSWDVRCVATGSMTATATQLPRHDHARGVRRRKRRPGLARGHFPCRATTCDPA